MSFHSQRRVIVHSWKIEWRETKTFVTEESTCSKCCGSCGTSFIVVGVSPTCVAPRHVDASRDFYVFSERAAWEEGGGCAAKLFFVSPVQQTTSGISNRVIFFFFQLATKTLNV